MKNRYTTRPDDKRSAPVKVCASLCLSLVALVFGAATPLVRKPESVPANSRSYQLNRVASTSDAKQQAAENGARTLTLDFDAVDASFGQRVVASPYLAKFGIAVKDATPGTKVVILDTRKSYDGHGIAASSKPNALSQENPSNDPCSFTLEFGSPLKAVRFTRPMLLAGPTGITFPEWSAQALDSEGRQLDEVGEPLGRGADYYSNVPAKRFTLNGPSIKAVRFYSNYK